jgi:hypothetical protein
MPGRRAIMSPRKERQLHAPTGRRPADAEGSPVGAVRVDVERSYAGIGGLLRRWINECDDDAWQTIRAKIDYTYECLDMALGALEKETGFGRAVTERIDRGERVLFKPNLVNPMCIDPQTHGPDGGSPACTQWPFVAALMRWFRDKLGISYHRMAVGEAATALQATAQFYSSMNPEGRPVTPEAVIEGRVGDFYGGWGFYFARKYLAECLPPGCGDDPMRGYEESVAGTYLTPGEAGGRLMVYDLNRIFDDPRKGREMAVPDGVNYKSVTLHKAVVGGDPRDPEDRRAYPGCVLVNVPKLKVHSMTLFTNLIKNLGIGLYPMQYSRSGDTRWEYSVPHTSTPGVKGSIPHQVWVPEMDMDTGLPRKDPSGGYTLEKTGGITATMIDILRAVEEAGVFMLHVVDGIESINHDHTGSTGSATKEPEGMVFAGTDPVATDLLSARYLFSNVPMEEAATVAIEDGHGGRFPQKVPVPTLEGGQIVTREGYDCPLARDVCLQNAERRGLGKRVYYVAGSDAVSNLPLFSIQGRLGIVKDGNFTDLITQTLFFDDAKMPWDLQRTTLSYLEAVDKLTGSSLEEEFLAAYDEDRDGIITYEEFGRKGLAGIVLHLTARIVCLFGKGGAGLLQGRFNQGASVFKLTDASWNPHGEDLMREYGIGLVCRAAYQMSLMDTEFPDLFVPGLTWGKGKWPSFELARHVLLGVSLYGEQYPERVRFPSLYGAAFLHADRTQNRGLYAGPLLNEPDQEGLDRYVRDVVHGKAKPLDFTVYVPPGFEGLAAAAVPNVAVSTDPGRVFTASFAGGIEAWP